MLFLFNSGARAGYIDNVLNTLHLPVGSENLYQYTYENDSYIDKSIKSGLAKGRKIKDSDVLIVFINKDKSPYEYIPLRRAKLILKEDKLGRSYFYVVLGEYCSCKGSYKSFNKMFIEKFKKKLFSSDKLQTIDTIDKKNNKGYLAFYGEDISEYIVCNENSWKKTVKKLSNCSCFENGVVFTKVDILKSNAKRLKSNTIRTIGNPAYTFKKGNKYIAELCYYIPFHDSNPTTQLCVEMVSNPDSDMLRGASLEQRLNIMDGMVKFRFMPTDNCNDEEIIFRICDSDVDKIKLSYKPFAYKVKSSIWQKIWLVVLAVLNMVLLYAINYCTALIEATEKFADLKWYYFVCLAVASTFSTAVIWLITKIFSKKR